jgi:hypothetical protein
LVDVGAALLIFQRDFFLALNLRKDVEILGLRFTGLELDARGTKQSIPKFNKWEKLSQQASGEELGVKIDS